MNGFESTENQKSSWECPKVAVNILSPSKIILGRDSPTRNQRKSNKSFGANSEFKPLIKPSLQ